MAETSRLSEIEGLVGRLPTAKRSTLLKLVTDLFLETNGKYRPEQVSLFDELFIQLLDSVETEAAAALSRRLAPLGGAPPKILSRLALNDDINVAEPVLVRSQSIEDAILLDIARNKGQGHLLALACRTQLAEEIVDSLIARGDEIVVRYVANNQGARISATGAAALTERAKKDEALAEVISKRSDVAAPARGAGAAKSGKTSPSSANAAA
jgi:uncharacterized protein (DUF2336 family)